MSDLAISVRLRADGDGLVGQLSHTRRELEGLKGSSDHAAAGAQHLARETGEAERSLRGMDAGAKSAGIGMSALKGALSALSFGVIAKGFADLTDASKSMNAELKLATATFGSLGQAQTDVKAIAAETRGGLAQTSTLYATFARNSAEMGRSQVDAARATETFAKTLKISGADTAAASSATTQFAQALASGVLRGDEFNTIMEASPRLSKLLADSLGVSVGSLRGMAEAGELTADKLYAALTDRKFTAGIDSDFAQLPVTFGDAMTQVHDAATITFGAFDRGGEFSNALVGFILDGSTGMKDLETRAEDTGINIRSAFTALNDVFTPMLEGALEAFGTIRSNGHTLRDDLASYFDAADWVGGLAAKGANAINGLTDRITGRPATPKVEGPHWGDQVRARFDSEKQRREGERSERKFYDNLPASMRFGAGGLAGFLAGEGAKPPRAPIATGKKPKAPKVRSPSNNEVGRSATGVDVDHILRALGANVTSGLRSPQHNKAVGGQPNSYHLLDQARDIAKGGGLTLGGIKAAFHERGILLKEALDEGDHFHIAWGKQFGKVASANNEAAKSTRALASDLSAIRGSFDPVQVAADNYAETLARIDRLEKAGAKNGGIDPDTAQRYRKAATEARLDAEDAAERKRRGVYLDSVSDDFRAAFENPLEIAGPNIKELLTNAGEAGGEAFGRSGIDSAQAIAQIFGGKIGGILGPVLGALSGLQSGNFNSVGGPIGGLLTILTGKTSSGAGADPFSEGLHQAFRPIRDELAKLPGMFGGLFGPQGNLTKALGKVGGYAAIGSATGQLPGLFGAKTSSLGGSLGGVAGGVLGGIGGPLGAALGASIGGVFGSIVGGLFKKTPTGSVVINSATGKATTAGKLGGELAGGAGSVQQAVQQIAEQLGGTLGGFNVAIGKRGDEFRVSASGSAGNTTAKRTGSDIVYKGKDEAAATAAAIQNALADGAVKGLSGAVQRALSSSSDINAALKEAGKVGEVEDLLRGTAGALERQFRDLERQDKDRLRIAIQYGFDVSKIEETSARDRLKLVEDTLKSSIGSLRTLLDDLNFGDLFEGSATDKRQQLLVRIAKAEGDAKGGVEGAADQVATLRRELVASSRDAFGTAGPEYAADRESTRTAAETIIAQENVRVKAAQDAQLATNAKLDEGNALTNETNDMLAQQTAILRSIAAGARSGGGGSAVANFSTMRQTELS